MEMVRHQRPRMTDGASALARFGEDRKEHDPVEVGVDDVHPIHTTVGDVVELTGFEHAFFA
jgi:hypothetical protein